MKDSPSFKTLISSLLSGTLDKLNTFVEIGSGVCDVGPGSFFACSYFACSSLITENSKYFDKVVELQQKTLDTFNNLTHKTTKRNKNILDNTRMLESLAGCRTMFLFTVSCNIGALERNAY